MKTHKMLENAWISVEDNLPEKDTQKVIVYNKMFYAPSYIETATYSKNGWMLSNSDSRLGKITHWQPLPEPPK